MEVCVWKGERECVCMCVSLYLLVVGAQAVAVRVGVGEQAALQHLVGAGLDARHEVRGRKRRLLDL